MTSSFTAYDFPAPDVAKTVEFAFGSEKRSKMTRLSLWRLTPYRMPLSLVRSELLNGKLVASGDVFMLRVISSSSRQKGSVEFHPCSIWKSADFVRMSFPPRIDSRSA